MYIKRKVFSVFTDEETGEERLYSTTEILSEESYLEQKEFGKYDKKLAEQQGKTIEQIRQERAGFKGTGTVHDRINLRSGAIRGESAGYTEKAVKDMTNSELNSAFGRAVKARKEGYTNANVRRVNKNLLADYKAENLGFNKSAYKRASSELKDVMDQTKKEAEELTKNKQELTKNKIKTQPRVNKLKETPKVEQPRVEPKPASEKVLKSDIGNKLKSSGQRLAKKRSWVARNPKTAAIGAGALGLGIGGGAGVLAYKNNNK